MLEELVILCHNVYERNVISEQISAQVSKPGMELDCYRQL